jgi:D-mannonate dehydratase
MYGETQDLSTAISAGYEMTGKVFAAGYIKGICESLKIHLK